MKKINNKGMTLMELIVSVALISVLMIFMYKLISDVRSEKKENDKFTDNMIKVSEIVVDLENRIVIQDITKIEITKYLSKSLIFYNYKNKSENYLVLFEVANEDNDTIITISTQKESDGTYDVIDNSQRKWTLKNLTFGVDDIEIKKNPDSEEILNFINIVIPLKGDNDKNIIEIELPYYNSQFEYSLLDQSQD